MCRSTEILSVDERGCMDGHLKPAKKARDFHKWVVSPRFWVVLKRTDDSTIPSVIPVATFQRKEARSAPIAHELIVAHIYLWLRVICQGSIGAVLKNVRIQYVNCVPRLLVQYRESLGLGLVAKSKFQIIYCHCNDTTNRK